MRGEPLVGGEAGGDPEQRDDARGPERAGGEGEQDRGVDAAGEGHAEPALADGVEDPDDDRVGTGVRLEVGVRLRRGLGRTGLHDQRLASAHGQIVMCRNGEE